MLVSLSFLSAYAQCCHGDVSGVRHVHSLYYQATVPEVITFIVAMSIVVMGGMCVQSIMAIPTTTYYRLTHCLRLFVLPWQHVPWLVKCQIAHCIALSYPQPHPVFLVCVCVLSESVQYHKNSNRGGETKKKNNAQHTYTHLRTEQTDFSLPAPSSSLVAPN